MKTVIEMALESKVAFDSEEYPEIWQTYMDVGRKELERFAELIRADEREACAKVCEQEWNEYCTEPCGYALAVTECVAAIRARGQA